MCGLCIFDLVQDVALSTEAFRGERRRSTENAPALLPVRAHQADINRHLANSLSIYFPAMMAEGAEIGSHPVNSANSVMNIEFIDFIPFFSITTAQGEQLGIVVK